MSYYITDKKKITKKIIETFYSDQQLDVERVLKKWWNNPRSGGGFGLTEDGERAFQPLENWEFKLAYFETPLPVSYNQFLLILDKKLKCPYRLFSNKKELNIKVYDGRIAMMISLHNPNYIKYIMNLPDRGE